MNYPKSNKYVNYYAKIMGPNPLKLLEELMGGVNIKEGSVVGDLGSGEGLTSIFLAKEYNLRVYALDLWSNPSDNQKFFKEAGLNEEQITAVKCDATDIKFEKEFFDHIISVDSYNYFGRDPHYLDDKLLPFIKKGGLVLAIIPGVKYDIHQNIPEELLLSWNKEQLEYMQDIKYWTNIISQSKDAEIISISQAEINQEAWDDWLKQDNEYARNDRKSINAGAIKYLNFIKIVLRKK